MSKTKMMIEVEKIGEIFRNHYGDDCSIVSIESLDDGMYNASCKVQISLRELPLTVVLKVSPEQSTEVMTYEKDIMKTELHVYEKLHESMDIPLPKVLFHDFSQTIISADYIGLSYLQGTPMNKLKKVLTKDDCDMIKEQIGSYMKGIHQIHGTEFGYIAETSNLKGSTWYEAYHKMIRAVLEDANSKQLKFPIKPAEIIAAISKDEEMFNLVKEPSLNHFDLWEGNIFLIKKDTGYEIEGIIDGERAFYGDPLCDVVSSVCLFGKIENEHAFLKGLGLENNVKTKLTNEETIRITHYRLYLYLLMFVEMAYRDYGGFIYKKFLTGKIKKVFKKIKQAQKGRHICQQS